MEVRKTDNTKVADTPGRWRAGEIVTVLPVEKFDVENARSNLAVFKVTDCPYRFKGIKQRLTRPYETDLIVPEDATLIARRTYTVSAALLAGPREITWTTLTADMEKRNNPTDRNQKRPVVSGDFDGVDLEIGRR